MSAACAGEPRDPIGILEPPDRPSGRTGTSSQVVGTWRAVIVIAVGDDLQEWTTEWRFAPDRTCRFERDTLSLVEGVRRLVIRECTYVDRGNRVDVTYDDTDETESLPYEFPDLGTERLLIQGVEYERIE